MGGMRRGWIGEREKGIRLVGGEVGQGERKYRGRGRAGGGEQGEEGAEGKGGRRRLG